MTTLFGVLTFGRLPKEQQRHQSLLKLIRQIMATQNESAALLNLANEQLKASNARITETRNIVVKVGAETDTLKQRITDLENSMPDNASQELEDAVAAIKETVGAQSLQIDALKTSATAVDEKVPDAPTT